MDATFGRNLHPITPSTFIHKIAKKPSMGWRFYQIFAWPSDGLCHEKVFE
jgi:hypothetical protein